MPARAGYASAMGALNNCRASEDSQADEERQQADQRAESEPARHVLQVDVPLTRGHQDPLECQVSTEHGQLDTVDADAMRLPI